MAEGQATSEPLGGRLRDGVAADEQWPTQAEAEVIIGGERLDDDLGADARRIAKGDGGRWAGVRCRCW